MQARRCESTAATGVLTRRAVGAALLLPLIPLVAALAPSPTGGRASADPAVAVLELAAPATGQFTLRGTFPVPPGTYPLPGGVQPFAVRDSIGRISLAQTEVVTWFADDAVQGAQVVEVLARVGRPPGVQAGDRIRYDVIRRAHARQQPRLTPAVRALLSQPGQVLLTTQDAFGHRYTVDLLGGADGKRLLRGGSEAAQLRCYEMMRPQGAPVGPPTGALPRFMGVHSYATYWSEENAISLDLRVHNGTSGHDPADPVDDPQADLYFDELSVLLPQGWTVQQAFNDPFLGKPEPFGTSTAFPLVRGLEEGKLHILPSQAQFHRRLVIVPERFQDRGRIILRGDGQGFARRGENALGQPLWSWWEPTTAGYFPQRQALPDLEYLGHEDMRGRLKVGLEHYAGLLRTGDSEGVYPIHSTGLGWAHPWGTKYGGMTGGAEIFLYDGLTTAEGASLDGYRLAQLTHRMYTDRQPVALYDKDGRPTRLEEWATQSAGVRYLPMNFFLRLMKGPDPFGFDQAPTFQVDHVRGQRLNPAYEDELVAHNPIDLQHLVRYMRSAKVLAWLGNDALAKDDLLLHAELARLSYCELPNNAAGSYIPSTLYHDMQSVAQDPGRGFSFGRGEAWCVDVMSTAYSLGDAEFRSRSRPWFDLVLDMLEVGQVDCTGAIEAVVNNKLLGGQFRARQAFEQAIIENTLLGMAEGVYRAADDDRFERLREVLRRSLYSMVNPPAWNDAGGPWIVLAVGPLDLQQPAFCGSVPHSGVGVGPDKYQVWSSYAYGWHLTRDDLFLRRAAQAAGSSVQDLLTALQAKYYYNIENKAALIALAQQLQGP